MDDDPRQYTAKPSGKLFVVGWIGTIAIVVIATAGLVLARELWIGRQTSDLAQQAAAGPEPIEPLLAKADPKKGEQIAKVCVQCHTFNKGGSNKIGPNLWGITEENMAAVPNYQFSAAMEAHKSDKWDADKLNQWLWKPQSLIKGTKMTFAGLPKAEDRADVIVYLDTLK